MLKIGEIKKLIDEDKGSLKKRDARVGLRYYDAEHDILNYRVYYFNADGKLVEDKETSNVKISHAFFTELVDQKVNYLLSGKDAFVKSDAAPLQERLDEYFGDDFKSELADMLTYASGGGFSYLYARKNEDDRLSFEHAEGLGVVDVSEKDADDGQPHTLYYYAETVRGEKQTFIQAWDKDVVSYFVMDKDGEIAKDDRKPNPSPHIAYTTDGGEKEYGSFDFVPFFRFDNNKNGASDLGPVKALIDDYDLHACGLSNNLVDLTEGYFVARGFQGDNIEEMVRNVKTKRGIGVPETEGGLDIKVVDIPYQARKEKLEIDRSGIYRFGMGFDSTQTGDGNITNVVIKSRYSLLDIKCNKTETRLKKYLGKLIGVVLDEINENEGTAWTPSDVRLEFTRETISNEKDNAEIEKTDAETKAVLINTILNVATILPQEIVVRKICEIFGIDYEEIKSQLPIEETE